MLEVFEQLPWLLPVCLLCLGLVLGSFFNVVIYRLPLMMEARWRGDCCELLELPREREAPRLTLASPNSH
nr:prepilin peptidase [Halioglobus sp.]